MTTTKQDVYDIVTEKVLAALEAGTVPWHKPWTGTGAGMPTNLVSKKAYRGINVFLLSLAAMEGGYESPYWLTYKQAQAKGGNVRKGEHSTLITFWKRLDPRDEVQPDGTTKVVTPMLLRYFRVFNVEQCDGVDYPRPEKIESDWDPIAEAESVVSGYLGADGAPTFRSGGDRASYPPSRDLVGMPSRDAFEGGKAYYSTMFHELTHSTGHASRLARKDLLESHSFGDASYSREELVAEMGAAMLSAVVGIEQATVGQSAAYVGHWLNVLRGDHKLVVQAAAQAQRAADRIRGITYEKADDESAGKEAS
jgi:antirestriction protein ArdC